jgi:predicted signal transduction protein with EAL and GGDEF domain
MGISALAEGVETKDQVAALTLLGCQVGQGFYFSQPLRAEEFDELLFRHFAPSARPSRTALTGEGVNASSITALSPVLACTSDSVTLPG